jgi:hypothetical protein
MDHLAFMWFERMMVWSRDAEGRVTIDDPRLRRAMVSTMQDILEIESVGCRMAALHGLNHLHHEEPSVVGRVVDEFLLQHPNLDENLLRYAAGCREGSER